MKHRHGRSRETGFDEAIIGCLAPHILVLHTDDQDRMVYLVAGSAVERAVGMRLRGTCFLDQWDQRDHQVIRDFCHLALASHRPLCLLSFCGSKSFEFETVLVPVTMSGVARKRFIGISMALTEEPTATLSHRVQHLTHIGFVHDELIATRAAMP